MRDYAVEFNNLSVIAKHLLYRGCSVQLATGLGVNIPTGQDVHIRVRAENRNFTLSGPGVPQLPAGTTGHISVDASGLVENATVNLQPFVGAVYAPGERFFAQGFMQVDVPVNPSRASFGGSARLRSVTFPSGATLDLDPAIGTIALPEVGDDLYQQALLRTNVGVGYWLWHNPAARLSGLAPTLELHYTTTLEDAKVLRDRIAVADILEPELAVGNLANRVDTLNLTLGTTLEINNRSTLATGFVLPLRSGFDKPFDFEFILQFNWRF
jgi:hypothetical protein